MFEELNEQAFDFKFWITTLLTSLIVFFTWKTSRYSKQQAREMMPHITRIEIEDSKKGELAITIVNTKPHQIVVKDITYKTKHILLWGTRQKTSWRPPQVKAKDEWENKVAFTQDYISDASIFFATIPSFNAKSTYKLFVETSGGLCQAIYHPKT